MTPKGVGVPALVHLDQIGENIKLLPFRASLLGIHQFFNAGKRGRVVRFGPDRLDLSYTSSTLTESLGVTSR